MGLGGFVRVHRHYCRSPQQMNIVVHRNTGQSSDNDHMSYVIIMVCTETVLVRTRNPKR